jgi:hypothetical protein
MFVALGRVRIFIHREHLMNHFNCNHQFLADGCYICLCLPSDPKVHTAKLLSWHREQESPCNILFGGYNLH